MAAACILRTATAFAAITAAASAAAGAGALSLPHGADGGEDRQGDRKEDQDIPDIHAVFLTRFL